MSSNEIPRELRHCVSFIKSDEGGRWGIILTRAVATSAIRLTTLGEVPKKLFEIAAGEDDLALGFEPADGRVTPPCLNEGIPANVRLPILQLVGENFDVQVNAEGEARAFSDDVDGIETMVKDLLRLLRK